MTNRKLELLALGLALAEKEGIQNVSRAKLAERSGMSEALLSYYWTATGFRADLLAAAILRENLTVIAQGLALRHPIALGAPLALRQAAAATLVGGT